MSWTNEDWRQAFRLRDKATGAALDVTGWALRMQWRARPEAAAVLTLDTGGAAGARLVIEDGPGGLIRADAARALMAAVAPGRYRFDVVRVQGGQTDRLFGGAIRHDAGVTSPP